MKIGRRKLEEVPCCCVWRIVSIGFFCRGGCLRSILYFVIDFIASLVVGSGIEGSFALHRGIIGLVVFAVFICGVYYSHYYGERRNKEYNFYLILCISLAAFGLLLMLNDIYDLGLWLKFQH